jgi:hypothetical protein
MRIGHALVDYLELVAKHLCSLCVRSSALNAKAADAYQSHSPLLLRRFSI